ncbi:MAG: hypothetical protein P9X27_04470 [Candidatus Kaelpia aquatica]|nr:hypothetical protein [Candidatus Kaelpia aquatica]
MFTDENQVIRVTNVPVDESGMIAYQTNSSLGVMFPGQFRVCIGEEYANKRADVLFSKDQGNSMVVLRVEIDGQIIIDETMVSYLVNENGIELYAPSCSNNVFGVEPFQDYFYFRSRSSEGDNALYIVNQRLSTKGGFILFSRTYEEILSDQLANAVVVVKVERESQSEHDFIVSVIVVEDKEGRPIFDKFGKSIVYHFRGVLERDRFLSYSLELIKGSEL